MTKPIEHSFCDWECYAFGYGYGTGEPHTIAALQAFLRVCNKRHNNDPSTSYDYKDAEAALTPTVAWLLINTLCRTDIIEYGSSPRFGWLTPHGELLRTFMLSKSVDELYQMTSRADDYVPCCPNTCNCGPKGYQAGVKCDNPFWSHP